MREIKFRGKRKDTGDWVYGGIVHQTDFYGDAVDRYFIIDGTVTLDYDIGKSHKVIPETVGQYTGLKDKNGVEIYEGDVHQYDGTYFEVKFGVFFDEEFQEESYGWFLHDKKQPDAAGRLDKSSDLYVEIVGNIHEEGET